MTLKKVHKGINKICVLRRPWKNEIPKCLILMRYFKVGIKLQDEEYEHGGKGFPNFLIFKKIGNEN